MADANQLVKLFGVQRRDKLAGAAKGRARHVFLFETGEGTARERREAALIVLQRDLLEALREAREDLERIFPDDERAEATEQ